MTMLLAIDTAGPILQLALRRESGTDMLAEPMPRGQAERIFPAIAELIGRNDAAYADLGRIAVTTGPGSFTGVRIGLSAARGLGLALGIPVLGVPTLLAISLGAAGEPSAGPIAVLLDARRDEAWFQLFSAPGIADGPASLLAMEAARNRVPRSARLLTGPSPDIGRLAGFAASADPATLPPDAAYIRDADAKPQGHVAVARAAPA